MNHLFSVAILAGGLATRLHPLTTTQPKALIEINNEPFISHQLKLLRKNNIQQVVLCLGYLAEQVVDYVGDGSHFDIQIRYSYDGPQLLGTAGAIKNALPLLTENFFVLYGDSYLPCDYQLIQNHFNASNKLALMSVYHNQGQWDSSNVEFSNNEIIAYDKVNRTERMHYIDYGLGIFNRSAFELVPPSTNFDLAFLYQQILKNQQLAAIEIEQRFYEIGSFSGIKELETYLVG